MNMEEPESFFDWEQSHKKKSMKKKTEPKENRILNSIDLPHDFFKSYLKLWKSENMGKKD